MPYLSRPKWKTLTLLAGLIVGGILVAHAQRPSALPASGDAGRYQLFAGPDASHIGESLLYRIDTRTGKTWAYLACPACAPPSPHWSEIKEAQ